MPTAIQGRTGETMGNFLLLTDDVNDDVLREYAASWVMHVKAAMKRDDGSPRIEMRAIYDEEKAVEVVLEYVLEPKVVL